MSTRKVKADTPYGRSVAKERARLEGLLAARTNADGTPRKGLKGNVYHIKNKLAELPEVE